MSRTNEKAARAGQRKAAQDKAKRVRKRFNWYFNRRVGKRQVFTARHGGWTVVQR